MGSFIARVGWLIQVYAGPQFRSVVQSCPNLSKPMDCSMPCFPVYHQLLELVQTHPTISSSVSPVPSYLKSFPASGSFLRSQFFTSGGQNIGASASASVLPMNIPGLISFRMDWLDLPAVQRALESSPAPQFESISSSALNLLYGPTLTSIHDHWKNLSFG